MELFTHLTDVVQGKTAPGATRSTHWPTVRAAHLKLHPACLRCGGTAKLQVHHIKPFHLHPDLELDPANFVTLCEANVGGVNCHLAFGHLGNFKSFNVDVVQDATTWSSKIANRPMGDIT